MECIIGNGTDYQGVVNVGESGQPCLYWNDPELDYIYSKDGNENVYKQYLLK